MNKILSSIKMKQTQVYLSLGGNQGDVLPRLQHALNLLSQQKSIASLQNSHFYRTAPFQMTSPLWFVNAVCSFETFLLPQEIFEITQTIERQLGKVNKPKDAERPIDIDLLFYGDQMCQDKELEIPHPHWKERLFVLIPLADLIKEMILDGQTGKQHYVLQHLIQPLLAQTPQAISLLEKNPGLQ